MGTGLFLESGTLFATCLVPEGSVCGGSLDGWQESGY
jgi:hypothetical protein